MYQTKLNDDDYSVLKALYKKLEHNMQYYIGYSPNTIFDYSELYPFLRFSINNLGDPFHSIDPMSTHNIERDVLKFFANITGAPKKFSGYVTNGSTESNLYGLYLARKRYPHGKAYFSEHSHYCIPKNLDILGMEHEMIPSLKNGEIDYQCLEESFKKNIRKPAIIIANIGTTTVSAVDNVHKIKKSLKDVNQTNYVLHLDAAFDGMILPFLEDSPPFKFNDGIDSIAISCNKFIGSPIPCGIVLTKQKTVNLINRKASCVRRLDTTISGSRNGVTPLFIWYAIKRNGIPGFKKIVEEGLRKAQYALKLFNENKIEAWRNPCALTVVIPEIAPLLLKKWHVPTEHGWSSITMLPKTSYRMIDEFCEDLVKYKEHRFSLIKSDELVLI